MHPLNPILWGPLWVLLGLSTLFTTKESFKKPLVYLFLILILYVPSWVMIYMLMITVSGGVTGYVSTGYDVAFFGNLGRRLTHIAPVMVFLISSQVYHGELLISIRTALNRNL